MAMDAKKIKLPPESDLALLLRDAKRSGKLLLVDTGDAVYSVSVDVFDNAPGVPRPEEVSRSKEGIVKAAGRWKDIVDAEAFKAYVYERRRTSSRPPVRL